LLTDKYDYLPGEAVMMVGAGWFPGETVILELIETPLIHPAEYLYSVADSAGNIYNEYVVQDHDLGQLFKLTATGEQSGYTVVTAFADGGAACTKNADCNDHNVCTTDVCNQSSHTCQNQNVANGSPCSDGKECTDDQCRSGNCIGAPDNTNTCSDGKPCTDDACSSGSCVGTNDNTNTCSDGIACTADACVSGSCVPTANNAACSDGNVCTDDICTAGVGCSNPNNTAPCGDGVYCNGLDVCAGGTCFHAGDPCLGNNECFDACDESADSCADPSGTPCADDGNPCTDDVCDGNGLCAHPNNTAPCDDGAFCNGTDVCGGGICRHAGDPCANGAECANACNESADNCFDLSGSPCGSHGDTACDNPDTCDGAGGCQSNPEPTSTVCRADAGECDVEDFCDGTGGCSADRLEPGGTACGSDSDTVCDNPDTCNSGGECEANPESATTVCRPDAGECDVEERCDGAGSCPVDRFEPAGTACGNDGDTICDNPDTCDGSGECKTNPEPVTTVCRQDGGDCDVPERCDGAGGCPGDRFEPAGTACGSDGDTVCDNPDTCDAAGGCQPNPEPATTVCRADVGDCDVEENCDGAGECPADLFEPAGTACGNDGDTVCDNPDTCNGGGLCESNSEPATTVCRQDAGECDVEEKCDGAGACPLDSFEPADTSCGSSSDTVCDNPDTCNGGGACETNPEPATTVCRQDVGDCDVEEKCDGAGACPLDSFEPAGTSCGSAGDTVCDNPDTCNGEGACSANPEPVTTVCRRDAGECDVEERCDGAGECPSDKFEPVGTACGSEGDTVCDNPDTCNAGGGCEPNPEPATTVCRAPAAECDAEERCDGAGSCPADAAMPAGTPATSDAVVCTDEVCNGLGSPMSVFDPTNASACTLSISGGFLCRASHEGETRKPRLVFAPETSGSGWRVHSTNPGQFRGNVFLAGRAGSPFTLNITLPYPFVTQGSVPVKVHSTVNLTGVTGDDDEGDARVQNCFSPTDDITARFAIVGGATRTSSGAARIVLDDYSPKTLGATSTIRVSGNVPDSGLVYVTLHLEYGLKRTGGYRKDGNKRPIGAGTGTVMLMDSQAYTFRVSGSTSAQFTLETDNVFKANPGIAGLVEKAASGDPVVGTQVKIYDAASNVVASLATDGDGFYYWPWKSTGTTTTYNVKLVATGQTQSATLKANGFALVSFSVP
jgi:hypothetical protein